MVRQGNHCYAVTRLDQHTKNNAETTWCRAETVSSDLLARVIFTDPHMINPLVFDLMKERMKCFHSRINIAWLLLAQSLNILSNPFELRTYCFIWSSVTSSGNHLAFFFFFFCRWRSSYRIDYFLENSCLIFVRFCFIFVLRLIFWNLKKVCGFLTFFAE